MHREFPGAARADWPVVRAPRALSGASASEFKCFRRREARQHRGRGIEDTPPGDPVSVRSPSRAWPPAPSAKIAAMRPPGLSCAAIACGSASIAPSTRIASNGPCSATPSASGPACTTALSTRMRREQRLGLGGHGPGRTRAPPPPRPSAPAPRSSSRGRSRGRARGPSGPTVERVEELGEHARVEQHPPGRQRHVLAEIGHRPQRRGQELLARHREHRRDDRISRDVGGAHLAVHHGFAGGGVVDHAVGPPSGRIARGMAYFPARGNAAAPRPRRTPCLCAAALLDGVVCGATWRSGYAADCKSVHTGSIPAVASNT